MKTRNSNTARAAVVMLAVWPLICPNAARATDTIPLCEGLTIVTAVNQQAGDYESIKTIESISDTEVQLRYSTETKNSDMFATSGPELKKLNVSRTMLVKDLQSATDYQQVYLDKSDEKIPGVTSIGTSTLVLQNLKDKGQSPFGYSNAYADLALSADRSKYPNYYSYLQRGTLQRATSGPTTMRVIVNDIPVDLPIVRGTASVFGDQVEFDFLDDPANPMTLGFRIGIDGIKPLIPEQLQFCAALAKAGGAGNLPGGGNCSRPQGGDRDVLRVTKIEYRCQVPQTGAAGSGGKGGGQLPGGAGAGSGSGLEKALANQQKVDIYSIYFSFNSDELRDESKPTLKEIADILTRHPDWKLAVSGHTDSIGNDQYNLDLSKRRAASVVHSLVTNYHINAGRLKSNGYGKSQPKDTNDTLEGRSRNRRVELMRF